MRNDGTTFECQGLTFSFTIEHDESMGPPWKEHDGHGVVSDWTTRPKRAGEKVLASGGQYKRYYDIQATLAIAIRDGWDTGTRDKSKPATEQKIAACAVDADFEHLRAWCADEWYWVGVCVQLLDIDGNEVHGDDARSSLWGMESSETEYHAEVARELADGIADDFKGKDVIETRIRAAS